MQLTIIATSIPGAILEITDISSMMSGGKAPIEIKVSGEDLPTLRNI